jgi:hypothetical protein
VNVSRHASDAKTLVWGGIVAGVLLRLVNFAQQRPLWFDEISLALNIGSRSAAEMLQPLDFAQGGPPLYLLITKLSTSALGFGPLALRLPALVAGLAVLALVPVITRRIADDRATVVATWLTALSPVLLYYSNETKQYALDALVGALLLLLAIRVVNGTSTTRDRSLLTALGVAGPWISLPSVFSLGAIGLVLLVDVIRKQSPSPRWVFGSGFAWVGSLALAYLVSYRTFADDPLRGYWDNLYLTADAAVVVKRLPAVLGGLPSATFFERDFFALLPGPLRLMAIALAMLLVAIAAWRLLRGGSGRILALLLGPLALAFLAYLVRQYPFTARVLCFAAPGFVVLVAMGMVSVTRHLRPVLVAAAVAAFLVPAAYYSAMEMRDPGHSQTYARPAIDSVGTRRLASEPIYVSSDAIPVWLYYTTDWSNPDLARIRNGARVYLSGVTGQRPAGEPVILHYNRTPYNEVYGGYSGAAREVIQVQATPVLPGWGDSEMNRLKSATQSCAWVFYMNFSVPEFEAFKSGLSNAHGTIREVLFTRKIAIRHVCFA